MGLKDRRQEDEESTEAERYEMKNDEKTQDEENSGM